MLNIFNDEKLYFFKEITDISIKYNFESIGFNEGKKSSLQRIISITLH